MELTLEEKIIGMYMRNERISKIKQDLNVKNQYIYDVVQRFKKEEANRLKKEKREKKSEDYYII